MFNRRQLLLGVSVCSLVACAKPPIGVSADEISRMKLIGVDVDILPEASIVWNGIDTEFAQSKGVTLVAPVASTDSNAAYAEAVGKLLTEEPGRTEFRAFVANRVKGFVEPELRTHIARRMVGSREVRFRISLFIITVVHSAVRLLTPTNQMLAADFAMIDAKTGQVLASHPRAVGAYGQQFGLVGMAFDAASGLVPMQKLSSLYVEQIKNWMFDR